MRSRSDRDQELQLSWAHPVTLIHTDINFRVTDSVARTSLTQRGQASVTLQPDSGLFDSKVDSIKMAI